MADTPRPDPHPELRASDADRERTADLLRHAAGEGRLDVEELDERLDLAYAARTGSQLEALTLDVVPRGGTSPQRRGGEALSVVPGREAPHWILSVMGGATRKGRWRLGERTTALNLMGGCDLDLHGVELGAREVHLTVVSIMGGGDIRVPDGLDVRISEVNVLGGNDVQLGEDAPDAGGPVLHLHLVSIVGGTNIRRGRKLSRQERKALKAAERSGGLHRGH